MATFGGGLSNHNVVAVLFNSTFSSNTATFGGALNNASNNDTISSIFNSTFSGNSATFGGAIHNGDEITSINNVTFSGNSASSGGGGIHNTLSGVLSIENSIVANTPSGGDCANNGGSLTGSTNLSDGSCPGSMGAVTNLDAVLQGNGCAVAFPAGGCIKTHAILEGSNAIDAGNPDATTNDQRGFGAEGRRDIGAFEFLILDRLLKDGFEGMPSPP